VNPTQYINGTLSEAREAPQSDIGGDFILDLQKICGFAEDNLSGRSGGACQGAELAGSPLEV
jgi:hypothetical protein